MFFFANFYSFSQKFFSSTSTTIFSVIYCVRQLLFTIFIKFRQKSFLIWFQIGSNLFVSSHKLHLKKTIFPIFCRWTKMSENCFFKMQFVTTSKRVWPNLKSYSERFLSEFYENGKQNLPTLTNNWVIESWIGCKIHNTGAAAAGKTSTFI